MSFLLIHIGCLTRDEVPAYQKIRVRADALLAHAGDAAQEGGAVVARAAREGDRAHSDTALQRHLPDYECAALEPST